jgi:Spy/CpxP family protein refolding chaperone
MAEELKLTDEQRKQVSKLVLENATRQEELIQKRKAEFEAQKKYRLEQEKKISSILTEEQKVIWEQRKESLKQRMGGRGEGGHERHRRGLPRFRRGH